MDHGRIQDLDTPFGLVHRLDTAYRIPFHTPRALSEDRPRRLTNVGDVVTWSNGANGYPLGVGDTRAALSGCSSGTCASSPLHSKTCSCR
jgi:hypothetical protein